MTAREAIQDLKARLHGAIIGQERVIDRLLIALLADGHVLMEGLPGLAKTRSIKTLARHLECTFRRIQFTPDLLPADVVGTQIFAQQNGVGTFTFQPGPIFGNLILADEINRAPAKVQSALLEAMEERQVTVAGMTHPLPAVFLVLATQNPIEQEGTYPLPEAQTDRFLMKVVLGYGTPEQELQVLRLVRGEEGAPASLDAGPRLPQQVVLEARKDVHRVFVAPEVEDYMVRLVYATREPANASADLARWVHIGSSPRGTLALDRCSRAYAWLQGRDYVTPEDVRAVALECLRHRLILSYEAAADNITADQAVQEVIRQVTVP